MVEQNNNYCGCTDGTPQYIIRLNQQGPPGKQGAQGPQGTNGYSPEVIVYKDTPTEYILKITTAFGSYLTPNLLANASEAAVELVDNLRKEVVRDYVTLATEQIITGSKTFNTYNNLTVQKDERVNNSGNLYSFKPVVLDSNQVILNYQFDHYSNGILEDTSTETIRLAKFSDIPDVTNLVTNTQLNTALEQYTTTSSLELLLNDKVDTDVYYTDKVDMQSEIANKLAIETYNQDKQTYALKTELPVTATTDTLGLVKPDGVTITIDNGVIKAVGGGGTQVDDKYGIRGDYATHFGILDCPNGLIEYNATGKAITVNQGIVLQLAGQDTKTTIASPIAKTLTSTGMITLFYGGGELLEVGQVDYSTTEPTDNGVTNYQAWYNPELGKWKFKSNDTGNTWRELIATPIANINLNEGNITRVDYIGYRILDDDIIAQQTEVESLQETIATLQQTITQLEVRMQDLETNINGGNA